LTLTAAAAAGLWRILAGRDGRSYPPFSTETNAEWVKYHGNPVLGGHLGTCFDVCLVRRHDHFSMWFSWRPKASIALVTSRDGVHWDDPTIALPPDLHSGWEDVVNRPVVAEKADGFHMWYTGQAQGHSAIGYVTSADGLTWERIARSPVLTADAAWEKVAVMAPHVLWDERRQVFRMWYSGGDQSEPDAIGYATSMDGRHWTKDPRNPIFGPDVRQPWERAKVTACQVVPDGDGYLMFYIGFSNAASAQIGVARSRDGVTGWRRHPANPIIHPGLRPTAWDYDAVYKPFALRVGDGWMLWYNGRNGTREQIGLALHPQLDLHF